MVDECMRQVAKRNDTVRFIKLHNDDAEMEEQGVPAVLAYKGGEKFAGLVPLLNELPDDSELSAVSLETAFRRSVAPSLQHNFHVVKSQENQLTNILQAPHSINTRDTNCTTTSFACRPMRRSADARRSAPHRWQQATFGTRCDTCCLCLPDSNLTTTTTFSHPGM